jgi:hypothetical protein
LREGANAIVFEDIAEIVDMITHANLFNLVNGNGVVELHHKWSNSEILSIFHIHTLFGDVHPCPVLTAEINHVEILESVEFQLSMFGGKSCALNLKREAIEFGIA